MDSIRNTHSILDFGFWISGSKKYLVSFLAAPVSGRPEGLMKEQKGTALVGVLLVLLVLTILGATAFITSLTDLKISSNYHQGLQALYEGEAGLQRLVLAYRENPSLFLGKKTASEINFPGSEPDLSAGPGTAYWIDSLRYDPRETPAYAEVIMCGKEGVQNSASCIRATIYASQSGDPSGVPEIFKIGVVTAGTLTLSGPLTITGNLHANSGYAIEPPLVIEQLRSQEFTVTQSLDPGNADYRPPMEVSTISEKDFDDYRQTAAEPGNQILFGQQQLVLQGDQKGLLIFVDGDLTLEGSEMSGVTLVATGAITVKGSAVLNARQDLDTVFIAGRDIILEGSSEIAGVFWSNGSIKTSGLGRIIGSLVCQGNISQTGGFQFERVSRISNPFLSKTSAVLSFSLGGWSQI
jgi:PilX N-terminal